MVRALLLELVLGDLEQAGAGQASQEALEGFAVRKALGAGVAVELAGGLAVAAAEGFEHPRDEVLLQGVRRPEAADAAAVGCADVADAAGLARVLLVAEVAHQVEHAAAVGLGVADHVVELFELVVALSEVGALPAGGSESHVAVRVHQGAAVDPELLQGALEDLLVHPQALADLAVDLGRAGEAAEDLVELGHLGIVPAVEPLVVPAVHVGVEQDGP